MTVLCQTPPYLPGTWAKGQRLIEGTYAAMCSLQVLEVGAVSASKGSNSYTRTCRGPCGNDYEGHKPRCGIDAHS